MNSFSGKNNIQPEDNQTHPKFQQTLNMAAHSPTLHCGTLWTREIRTSCNTLQIRFQTHPLQCFLRAVTNQEVFHVMFS